MSLIHKDFGEFGLRRGLKELTWDFSFTLTKIDIVDKDVARHKSYLDQVNDKLQAKGELVATEIMSLRYYFRDGDYPDACIVYYKVARVTDVREAVVVQSVALNWR